MNGFDVTMIGILAVFATIGAWRGLVREVLSILTWVLACLSAWFFAGKLADLFKGVTDEVALQQVMAFVLIFVTVFALGIVASMLVHKLLPAKRAVKMANLIFGGLVGAARGGVIVVVIFLVAGLTSFPQRTWWHESTLTPYFERAAVYVSSYLPRDVARHIRYG